MYKPRCVQQRPLLDWAMGRGDCPHIIYAGILFTVQCTFHVSGVDWRIDYIMANPDQKYTMVLVGKHNV